MASPITDYDYEEKFTESLKTVKTNSMKQKLVAIKNLVVRRLSLERDFKALHFKVEAKYEDLYKPIYERRAKILEGSQEVTVEDIKEQLSHVSLTDINAPNAEKGVPGFWLKCLKNTAQFGQDINKKDEEVLAHLKDITVDFQDNGSFKIHFLFNANQFFDHTVLTREFLLDAEKLTISKITCTKVEWKSEDLNPTIEKKKKKVKNPKKKGDVKIVFKVEEVPSFFNFFKDYDVSKLDKKDKEEEDEDEEEEDEMDIIEEEYDLGLFIKEELIPYAIEYYLGIIKDEGEDDEDFEDEEEEEEEPKKKGGKKH